MHGKHYVTLRNESVNGMCCHGLAIVVLLITNIQIEGMLSTWLMYKKDVAITVWNPVKQKLC